MLLMDCLKLMGTCEKSQGVKIGQFTRTCACRPPPNLLIQPRQKNVGNMWRKMCQGLTHDLTQSERQVSLENPYNTPPSFTFLWVKLPICTKQSVVFGQGKWIPFRLQLRDCNGYWWLITENIQHFCVQLKLLMEESPRGTKPSASGSGIKKKKTLVNRNDEVHSTFTLFQLWLLVVLWLSTVFERKRLQHWTCTAFQFKQCMCIKNMCH